MDYLQYVVGGPIAGTITPVSFKPYYKWITFNTYVVINLCC